MKTLKQSLFLGICMLWYCLPALSQNASNPYPNTMLANVFTQNIATGISVPGGDGFTNAGIGTTTLTNNNFLSLTVGSNSPVCSGNSLNLTSTPSGGTAPYTYKWTGPNGFSSTQQNPTITNVTTAASGTYSLEVEDGLDNSSNASISVTVNPTPTVASISGNSTGCVGSTITLSDATPGGVWSSSNTTVATVSNAGLVSVKALGSTIISYTVTTVAGCSATVTKTISTASAVLHPDLIECNNGIASFNATDTYYGVTYSNSNAGNSFFWAITGGSFSYQGSSTASSQYPRVQLLTGSSFQVVVQFTTNGITCVDTQIVYKNSIAADTIQGSHDTTVCYNTAPINLLGKVSLVTNLYNWSTTGSGTFSNPNALNTTYTPSGTDKTIGVIKIYLQGSSTINSTGNCGTSTSIDSMTLRIAPDNTGTNSVQTICSNQSLNFTPVSTISGSTYSWASSVTAGSLTGNTASGTGNIIDSLVNLSSTGDAVVIYTIIPYSFTPTNNTCTGTPFTFTVTAKPKPAVTITNNATTICTGSNTNIQFSSSLTGSVYTWSSSVISGTASGNSSVAVATTTNQINDVLINNSTANATVRYHITAFSPSGCSNTDSTDVVIYALPTVANAGPDQALCDTTTAILAGNNPVSGTGNWAFLSGPSAVTFGAPSSPSGSVNGLIPGTYQLTWTISNGSCAVSKDTVVIINSAQSVAGSISANATVCAGNNNGTLTLSGYTGNIIRWESSTDGGTTWPTVINNTTSTYTYSNLTATTLFRAVVQNGACSFAYVNPVTITVNPISAPGTLTSDAIVCAGSNNGTLTLSGYTGNIIRWESSSDNGITWTNIANTTNTLTYTNLTITTLYRSLVQSGVCSSAYSNAVTITVNPQTIAGSLAADATVCATANSGTLSLSAYTGNIIRWESSSDNGTTWTNIANTTNTLTYNNLTITTLYRLLVQSGMCTSIYSNNATITVIQAVTTANAGSDQTLCYTTSASLAANTPASGTGTWTALTGNPSTVTFTNAADPATTINGLTTGTYLFVWTISNSACADSKDTVQITVNPQTVPGTIATSATVCANSNNGTLTLSGYTGSIIRWESSIDNGTTWINIANTGNALTYNNLNASTQYRAYVQSGVCPPLYSSIATITVIQPVTIANAGPDQTLCYTTSASLAANTPVSGTGTWTALTGNSSTVTFTNAADPATTINGLTTGTYLFVWTISNSTCADSKDTVQLTINPQTVPGSIAASATVCATSNNGTLTLSGYTGSILHWESSINNGTTWNNIVNTGNTLTYNNLATSTQYRAYVQSGVCPPLYSSIATITVIQAVTIANAGPDQSLCNVASATLAANTPTSGTGTWTAFAGNPSTVSFTNIASPATTVNGLTAGTYQFLWTISNGTCSDSKDTIQITVNPATNPGTLAADATVCATSNNGTLTLSNYLSSILRWESSVDNGSSWTNVANTSNTLAYNNLSATTKYRAYVQNAVCPSLYSNIVTITVLQPVTTANAGPDTTVINGITSYKLGANTPTSGTGTWSVLPGGPSTLSFVNPSDPNTTVGGLAFNPGTPPTNGNYKLVWTVSNGYCAISRDTMQITVQPPTNPGVIGPDAVVCTSNNHGTLVLSDYLGTVLQWESSIDYGATWSVIVSTVGTNQATYTYDNLTTTTLFRALVKNGVGAELYSGIAATVTVLQLVTPADAGPDQTLCNTTSTSLAANTPVSGVGIWSALAGNPSSVTFSNSADRKSVVNGLTIGTYRFVWTISNGICSDSRDTVNITIQLPTIAGTIEADATVCITSNTGTLSISGFRGSILQGEVSIDNGSSWLAIANTANLTSYIYNNLATTSQFRAKVQNGVCPALFTNIVTITVLQEATIANAGTDQSLCNVTATTLAANTPASGTGIWTALAGNPSTTTFTNPNNPTTTVNALTAGTYQFIWTISNALCADSKDTVRITVYSPSVAGTLAAAATVCANVNTGTLTLSGYVSSIIRWESSSNNGTTWNNIANTGNTFTYNNLAATIAYRAYVQNTVCPALYSNTVTINVVQPVTIANAGPDQLLCNVTATTLAANTPASGTGIWTAITGNPSTATFTNPNDPATTVNALTAGTYQFIWTISNALCADSKDTVRIIVYPPTIAGTLAAAATVCAAANTGTLTLSGNNGNIIHWESSSDNGTTWNNIAGTGNTFIYNNLTTATLFRVLIQNGVCATSYTNIVLVIVLQPSSIANAGNNQVLCNSSAAKLNATIPSSGAGVWAQVSGPTGAVFTNKQLPGTTVSGLTTGTYQFIWIIANGICPISTSTTTIKIDPPTFAGTLVNDNTVCTGTNTGTLTLSGFTGNIIRWETSTDSGASWTSITDTTVSSVYNNLTATTQYRVLVQSGVCTAMYSNMVTVTVNPASVPGKLSADAIVCATDNTGTLNLGSHTGNITRWEFSTDKGSTWTSINNTTDTYTYSNLGNTTRYRVMVQSGICSAAYSDIAVITVDPATVAGVLTGSAIVCFGRNGGNLTLTGKTGNVIHWESSSDKGITWYIIADTLTTYTYTNLTSTTQYRVLVKNGSCGLQYSNIITITVLEPATIANAGPDQVLCNANTSTILNGNIPASGIGKWRFISGPSAVTFADNSLPNAIVSGLQIGTYRFEWAISNGVCANSTSTVTVKVDQVKAWFNLTSMAICGKSTYQFIDKSLSGFGIDNWKWSINPGDTIPTKNYTIDFTEAGSYTVTLTAQSITGCTGTAQATFPVTIYQFPEVNINSIADACRSQLFQLSPVVNSRDSIAYLLWNMANGLKSKDSVVTVQYTNTGNYTIKLTVSTVNHCLDSAYKKITIHSAPVLTVNNSATICKGDSIQLQANGAMSYIWTDQYNNVICNNCSSPKVKPINNIQFKVIGYNEYGCSDIKTTNVNVIQPLKMLASSGDTICAGTTKQLFAAGAVNYSWYPETGLSSKTSARPFANPLATTTYRVVGKDNFNCFSDTAEVRIVVGHPTPIRLGKDTIIMAGQPYQLNVTAATGDIRKWHWNGSQGLSCLNCPTPQLRVSDDVCISCLAVNIYGCVSTDTVCIKTFCPSTQLFVPNAFTPDGDGINDVLLVQGSGIKMIKSLRIFNRWGEMVFQKTNFLPGDPAYAWDGKIRGNAAPPDVFVYMCEVICEKGLPSIFKGNTAILK